MVNKSEKVELQSSTHESVNHYHLAAVLAEGYSHELLPSRRESKVSTIDIFSLINYVKNNNIKDRWLTDEETNEFIEDIIKNHKNVKNSILVEKKCEEIFKTPLLSELDKQPIPPKEFQRKNIITKIENDFLDFVHSGRRLDFQSNSSFTDQFVVLEYIKLSYARCPKVNKDYSIDYWDIYLNFNKHFPLHPYLFEINIKPSYFMLADLAPAIVITGNTLGYNKSFNLSEDNIKTLNSAPFIIFPFASDRAFILFFGVPETRKIIESILLDHNDGPNESFIYHMFGIFLTYSFKRLVYKNENERFIVGNFLRIISTNYSHSISYRLENNYPDFKNHLHQNRK